MPDDPGDDECVCGQIAQQDHKPNQCNTISDAGVRVGLFAEGFG